MANDGTNPDVGKQALSKSVEQQLSEFRSSYDKKLAEAGKTIEGLKAALEDANAKLGEKEIEKEYAAIGATNLDETTKQARLKALQESAAVSKRQKALEEREASLKALEKSLSAKQLANEFVSSDELEKLGTVEEMRVAAAEAKLKGIEAKIAAASGTAKPDQKPNLGGGTAPTKGEMTHTERLRSGISELMKQKGIN